MHLKIESKKSMQIFLVSILVLVLQILPTFSLAENIEIEFSEHDSYSIEVARINVGDTIKWIPKGQGHNVEFLAGPKQQSLPEKSKIDEPHSVIFSNPGVYLYGCTPHANMGMLGLVIVGNDLHNLGDIEQINLSPVADSVLKRLTRIARLPFDS